MQRPLPHQSGVDPIIQYVHVKKAFGPKKIYDDLHFNIYPGETLTVLGGSGTGKSVMIKMLIGLLKPDEGQVLFHDLDLAPLKDHEMIDVRKKNLDGFSARGLIRLSDGL